MRGSNKPNNNINIKNNGKLKIITANNIILNSNDKFIFFTKYSADENPFSRKNGTNIYRIF
jgi:hypothetical protein